MKKLLPMLLLVVLLIGCLVGYWMLAGKYIYLPKALVGCENEDSETPNDAVWYDGNDFTIDPNSELVRNLNLRYDPNFYSIVADPNFDIDSEIWLSIAVDANSISEAVLILRNWDGRKAKEYIDIEVIIGDETHTASFEDLFEWMGFER